MHSPAIKFVAPVALEAAATPSGPKKFRTVAYTGGALRVAGYSLPIVVDLAGLQARNSVTANLDHDPAKRVGHVTEVANDGRQLVLSGVVSAANAAAVEFVDSFALGYRWQASIEASPDSIDEVARGETANANGRQIAGPVYVARRAVLSAVAFVPNGADDFTHVSIAARRQDKPMTAFHEWIQTMGLDADSMDQQQLASVHANFNGRSTPDEADRVAVAPLIAASAVGPVEGESKRVAAIERACAGEWGDLAGRVRDIEAKAIAGTISGDEFVTQLREARVDRLQTRVPAAHTVNGSHKAPQSVVIEASFAMQGGLESLEKHYDDQTLDAAHKLGSIGLQEMLLRGAIAGGYHAHPGERITDGNLRRVLAHAFPDIRASGFSMANIPGILSNTSNKFLLDGWVETSGDEWRKIAKNRPVPNFKEASFYRMLDSLEYQQIGPDGEIKHGTLGEQSVGVKADTYAKMLAITRTDIINDDLGAITDAPRRLGQGAGTKFRRVFWGEFLANTSFFTANNGNFLNAAGTELTADGAALETALATFRAMRSPAADGAKLIGGKPAVLMVPPGLEIVGRRLLNSTSVVAGSDSGSMPSGNPFAGLAELVVVDWLADTDLGGAASDDAWYLLRSPNVAPAMTVGFLHGNESPTVESADADFNTLGIQMRGYHDFGCRLAETLCGVKLAGTPAE